MLRTQVCVLHLWAAQEVVSPCRVFDKLVQLVLLFFKTQVLALHKSRVSRSNFRDFGFLWHNPHSLVQKTDLSKLLLVMSAWLAVFTAAWVLSWTFAARRVVSVLCCLIPENASFVCTAMGSLDKPLLNLAWLRCIVEVSLAWNRTKHANLRLTELRRHLSCCRLVTADCRQHWTMLTWGGVECRDLLHDASLSACWVLFSVLYLRALVLAQLVALLLVRLTIGLKIVSSLSWTDGISSTVGLLSVVRTTTFTSTCWSVLTAHLLLNNSKIKETTA